MPLMSSASPSASSSPPCRTPTALPRRRPAPSKKQPQKPTMIPSRTPQKPKPPPPKSQPASPSSSHHSPSTPSRLLHTPHATRKAPASRIAPAAPSTTTTATTTTTTTTTAATATATAARSPIASSPRRENVERALGTPSSQLRRKSMGPLSEHTMSQIRCPSRVDFLNAVNGVAPTTLAFGSAKALARSRSLRVTHPASGGGGGAAAASPRSADRGRPAAGVGGGGVRGQQQSRGALRTSRLTDESPDGGVVGVSCGGASCVHGGGGGAAAAVDASAPFAGNRTCACKAVDGVSDADGACVTGVGAEATQMYVSGDEGDGVEGEDVVDEDDEDEPAVPAYLNGRVLDAMDRMAECDELRAIVQWTDEVRAEHALPTAMTDIDFTNGVALLEVLRIVAKEAFHNAPADADVVQRHLDEAGCAAAANIRNVRAALQRFPWRDGPDGGLLNAVAFDRVDVWGLAGFVVLAAVTGHRANGEVDRMLEMDEWVQDRLSDVVASGLDALGAGKQKTEERHTGWFAERRKRELLEDEVLQMRREIDMLLDERDRLESDLASERVESEKVRSELRWLRAAVGRRRRVLGETNDAATTNVDENNKLKDGQLVRSLSSRKGGNGTLIGQS